MSVPLDDRGLLLGDGLFETLLVTEGVVQDLASHLERMASGCLALGLPMLDRAAAAEEIVRAAASCAAQRAAVRLTLTAGSGGRGLDRPETTAVRLFATAAPSPRPEGPARVILAAARRNEGSIASRHKTLSYLDCVLARRQAREAGADEALMLNNRGEIASAAAANVFWVREGRLFTPALDCGVLAGTMRRRVIQAAESLGVETLEVHEAPVSLERAEALFLTNALIGIRPVETYAGAPFAESRLVMRLAEASALLT